jgi:hypothetical protein
MKEIEFLDAVKLMRDEGKIFVDPVGRSFRAKYRIHNGRLETAFSDSTTWHLSKGLSVEDAMKLKVVELRDPVKIEVQGFVSKANYTNRHGEWGTSVIVEVPGYHKNFGCGGPFKISFEEIV